MIIHRNKNFAKTVEFCNNLCYSVEAGYFILSHISTKEEDRNMKKWLALLCLLAVLVSATGCARIQGVFKRLDIPQVTKTGNVISWTAIEEAKTYDILVDGVLFDTTKETSYVFKEVTQDISVSVLARAENEYVKSKDPSDAVTVYQNAAFKDADTLTIGLEDNREYSVPANVKHLKVSGKAENSNIFIEERTSDLVITLDNADILSREKASCIQQRGAAKGSAIIVNIVGENRLTAAKPSEIPATPAKGSGTKGSVGINGTHGIQYENIVFMGNGNLSLLGSEGGKGGQGAEQDNGFFTLTQAGSGGNGGNGGSGLSCTSVALCMDSAAKIIATGGEGGKGGPRGVGHTSVAEGITSAMGVVNDGAQGTKGAACAYTNCLKLSGILIEN